MRKLNFGCGKDIKEGWDNKDYKDFDFNVYPYPIKDNTYDYILASHVLEHIDDWKKAVNELCRIMKPDGTLKVSVPFYNSTGAYYPMHQHVFAPASFDPWIMHNTAEEYIKCPYQMKMLKRRYNPLGLLIHNACIHIEYWLRVIKVEETKDYGDCD